MLKKYLESNKCFKLVCGAGNEDALEVEKLVRLYSTAGCKFFDVCAKQEIIEAAKKGLQNREGYICVSVGIKGDPHIRKSQIDYTKCSNCHKCEETCPQKAIKYSKVKQSRCIGCGKCFSVCKHNAISLIDKEQDLKEVLPTIIDMGIDCIEFHVMNNDLQIENLKEKWNYINSIYDGMLSICTSRGHLSDEQMVTRIKNMIKGREDYTTIVQADGFPMSGSKDDFKTTLQAVATAEIVQNAKLPVYIMLSGGTNSKTAKLAKMCEINYNGIAIGTFARKIVNNFIEREDFLRNKYVFDDALKVAQQLVDTVSNNPFDYK